MLYEVTGQEKAGRQGVNILVGRLFAWLDAYSKSNISLDKVEYIYYN